MGRAGMTPNAALGFLTVVEDSQHGLFGGYLVLNAAGRPLEFHCTAPVKPNRAQEILYGPTLEPFLYGEQIGQTLLSKAKTPPLFVFTDRPAAMAVRQHVEMPVALSAGRSGKRVGRGQGGGFRVQGSGFQEATRRILSTQYSVLSAVNPQPSTLNPQPSTLNPQPASPTGGSTLRTAARRLLGFNWDAIDWRSPRPTETIARYWLSGWALWPNRSI